MVTTPGLRDTPHIDILFLGSPGVGKATFLSRLPHVQHPSVAKRDSSINTTASAAYIESASTDPDSLPAPYASAPSAPPIGQQIQPLSDPLTFNVSLFARPYSITIHPATSPLFTDPFPPTPHFIVICFSVASRASLHNAKHYWLPQYHFHYPTSSAPIMLLGLQRDQRTAEMEVGEDGREGHACVMPEEGLEAAREMRCDRYAECSAKTGELMWEAVEDITRTAAKTTLDHDYASDMCLIQ